MKTTAKATKSTAKAAGKVSPKTVAKTVTVKKTDTKKVALKKAQPKPSPVKKNNAKPASAGAVKAVVAKKTSPVAKPASAKKAAPAPVKKSPKTPSQPPKKEAKPVTTKNSPKGKAPEKLTAKPAVIPEAKTSKKAVEKAASKSDAKAPAKVTPKSEAPAEAKAEVKAVKTRTKGVDKNYVQPPTPVLVQTSAKLTHLPTAAGAILNPAVIPAPVKKNPKLANNWKTKPANELTDAEIIAMPDEEYMNPVQMAFFKHRLVQLRDSILASASETTEHLRDDTVVVPDPTDRATIEEEHALELRTRDRERKLLKKIQQSISRLDQDDYGYCDETGEPIGVSRLIARPTATLSLEAQQRRELKQKMFGD